MALMTCSPNSFNKTTTTTRRTDMRLRCHTQEDFTLNPENFTFIFEELRWRGNIMRLKISQEEKTRRLFFCATRLAILVGAMSTKNIYSTSTAMKVAFSKSQSLSHRSIHNFFFFSVYTLKPEACLAPREVGLIA